MLCAIEVCKNTHYARGWCNKHYWRWYHTGSPLKMKRWTNHSVEPNIYSEIRFEDWAWAAGIFDGEGSFGNVNKRMNPRIQVGQTYKHRGTPDMLTRLQELFGGRVWGPYKQKGNRRDHYLWSSIGYERTQAVLCMTWKHLGLQKRTDAKIMLEKYPNR